ncbi:putative cation transporter [Trypanosoma grayi]|uniref:putative cation transporter n=1 Tax=Trypanosoma grayi TaxID=71804 RepID=UPI0004F47B0E|nr:putative cation transporter [Trypanosoma grayi]KEG08330.1 putative cation transporter [Trypanosoma grayi]
MINHAAHAFEEECVPESFKESYDAYALMFAMVAAILMHALDVSLDLTFASTKKSTPASEPAKIEEGILSGERVGSSSGEEDCCGHHSHAGAIVSQGRAQRVASALFMEFGVTLHSVFIGLTVGISSDADTKALLVALAFHQMFEGLALGSRLVDASMRLTLELLLALIFSISAPLGAAIGLGAVEGSKVSVTGTSFVLLQAIFDSLCGGILLYLGFVLMLSDFSADLRKHAGEEAAHRIWKRIGMFAALWAGAGIMAGIGKWL